MDSLTIVWKQRKVVAWYLPYYNWTALALYKSVRHHHGDGLVDTYGSQFS
jgi:hypothetical protein